MAAPFLAGAEVPATRPTTDAPARQAAEFAADSPVRAWFAALADPDPDVRDPAQTELMGLSRNDLPRLRALVASNQPPSTRQALALREIVRQVFLAAEPYETDRTGEAPKFIMGEHWPDDIHEAVRLGVPVVDRWPGFPARQLLRDGDMILGLYSSPTAKAGDPPDVPTPQVEDLVRGMRRCQTLPRLALSVLRGGRLIRVAGTLVLEPTQTADRMASPTAEFLADRQRKADDYWLAQFAPLVPPQAAEVVALDGSGP